MDYTCDRRCPLGQAAMIRAPKEHLLLPPTSNDITNNGGGATNPIAVADRPTLRVASSDATYVTLAWDDDATRPPQDNDDATTRQHQRQQLCWAVQWKDLVGRWVTTPVLNTDRTLTITDLHPASGYVFRVVRYDPVAETCEGPVSEALEVWTSAAMPPVPSRCQLASLTSTEAVLTWSVESAEVLADADASHTRPAATNGNIVVSRGSSAPNDATQSQPATALMYMDGSIEKKTHVDGDAYSATTVREWQHNAESDAERWSIHQVSAAAHGLGRSQLYKPRPASASSCGGGVVVDMPSTEEPGRKIDSANTTPSIILPPPVPSFLQFEVLVDPKEDLALTGLANKQRSGAEDVADVEGNNSGEMDFTAAEDEHGDPVCFFFKRVGGNASTPLATVTVPNLQQGVQYYWRVRSISRDGLRSRWSAPAASFTPKDATPLPTASALSRYGLGGSGTPNVTPSSATIEWTVAKYASLGYVVSYAPLDALIEGLAAKHGISLQEERLRWKLRVFYGRYNPQKLSSKQPDEAGGVNSIARKYSSSSGSSVGDDSGSRAEAILFQELFNRYNVPWRHHHDSNAGATAVPALATGAVDVWTGDAGPSHHEQQKLTEILNASEELIAPSIAAGNDATLFKNDPVLEVELKALMRDSVLRQSSSDEADAQQNDLNASNWGDTANNSSLLDQLVVANNHNCNGDEIPTPIPMDAKDHQQRDQLDNGIIHEVEPALSHHANHKCLSDLHSNETYICQVLGANPSGLGEAHNLIAIRTQCVFIEHLQVVHSYDREVKMGFTIPTVVVEIFRKLRIFEVDAVASNVRVFSRKVTSSSSSSSQTISLGPMKEHELGAPMVTQPNQTSIQVEGTIVPLDACASYLVEVAMQVPGQPLQTTLQDFDADNGTHRHHNGGSGQQQQSSDGSIIRITTTTSVPSPPTMITIATATRTPLLCFDGQRPNGKPISKLDVNVFDVTTTALLHSFTLHHEVGDENRAALTGSEVVPSTSSSATATTASVEWLPLLQTLESSWLDNHPLFPGGQLPGGASLQIPNTPSEYDFSVAATNSIGTGPYSARIRVVRPAIL